MKQRWIRVEHRQFVAINSLFTSRVMPGLNQFVHELLRIAPELSLVSAVGVSPAPRRDANRV